MPTYAFSGGALEDRGYGSRVKFRFGGAWVVGDTWTAAITSTLSGNFTLGKGNISGKTYVSMFKLRNRAFLGYEGGFAMSAIDDPTGWEEQNVGAAVIPFSTQFGGGDTVYGFSITGSRMVVFGEKSTQVWNIDADPSRWSLAQVLDNTGTKHTYGIQAIGEVDVFYPETTGIRSLRTKELSGDAFVSDVGTPIDSIIRAKIKLAEDAGYPICSAIEPNTKQYWVFIYDTIYVLTQSPVSKITAWATFEPMYQPLTSLLQGISSITGLTAGVRYYWEPGAGATSLTNGTEVLLKAGTFVAQGTSVSIAGASGSSTLWRTDNTFRPVRMFVVGKTLYMIGSNNRLYSYDYNTLDYAYAVAELPWLDLGGPSVRKQMQGIDLAAIGSWKVKVATNPQTNSFNTVLQTNVASSPTYINGSTYDLARYACSGNGTHFKIRMECSDGGGGSFATRPRLCALNIIYNNGNVK